MASILLIEDDYEICSLLREILEGEHEVIQATNGQDGVSQYSDTPTDLVILDILLPDMDGLETMKQLQRQDPNVNIVAISGGFQAGDIDVLRMAQRLGAKRTLAKPFKMEALLAFIQEILQQKSPGNTSISRMNQE